MAAMVIGTAVLTMRGSPPDASPIPNAKAFSLPSVVTAAPPTSLGASPGRPTVVNFFAAWCAPCTEELPLLATLARTPGAPAVVGVDVMDQRADALILMKTANVTFPAAYDHDGSMSATWGVTDGLPVTVFVAADGRIVAYHRGQLRQAQLDRLVRQLEAAR